MEQKTIKEYLGAVPPSTMKQHLSKLLIASAALVPVVAAQAPSSVQRAPPTTTATCVDALHTTEMVYTAFYSTFFESASAIYNIFGHNNTLFVNDAPTTVVLSTTLTTTIISTATPARPQSGVAFGAGLPAGRIDNTSTPFVLGYAVDPIAIIPTGFQTAGAPSADPKQATLYTLPQNMLAGLLMGGQFARNVGDAFNALAPTTAMGNDAATVYIQDGILHIVSAADGEGSFYACPDGLYVGFRSAPSPQCAGVVVGAIAASALGIQIPSRSSSMSAPVSTAISTPTILLPSTTVTTTTPAIATTSLPVPGAPAVCPANDGQVVGNYNIYCGVGLDGVNIDAATSQQPSLQACIDTCTASTAGCVSISYNRVTTFCYQHSTYATIETNIGGNFDSAEMVNAPPLSSAASVTATTTTSTSITVPPVAPPTTTSALSVPTGALCPGSPDGTVFSGYATFCGSNVNGGPDIVSAITDNVPSLEACIALCDRTQGCVGVSYMTGGSMTCYPHSTYNFAPTPNPNFNGAYNLNFAPGASVSSTALSTPALPTTPAVPTTSAAPVTTSVVPVPAGAICPGGTDATPYNGYLVFCGQSVNGGPDIVSAITNDVPSIEACIDICARTPTCVGVSHMVSGSKTCYPHSGYNFAPVSNAQFDGAYLASQPPNAPAVPLPVTSILPSIVPSAVGGLTSNLPVSAILSNPTSAVISQLTSILSNPTAVVSGVVGATSAISGVVSGVTSILNNPTAAVSSILKNPTSAVAPIVSAVTSVLPSPVVTVVGSLTRSVAPVVTSVLAPVSSVALPVTTAVAPVATAVAPIVSSAPVVGSVAAPVVASISSVSAVAPVGSAVGGLPIGATSVGAVAPIGGLGGLGGVASTTAAGVSPTAGGPAAAPTSQAQEYLPGAPYCTPVNGTYFGYEIHCEQAISAPGVNAFGGNIPAVGTGNLPYQTATLADCIALCNNVPTCVSVSWHYAGTSAVHECYLHNGDATFNIDIGYHSAIRLGTGSILLSQGNQGKTYAQGGGTAPVADPALAPYLKTPGVPPSSLSSFPTSTTPLIVTQTATPAPIAAASPAGVLPGLNLKRMGYGLQQESY